MESKTIVTKLDKIEQRFRRIEFHDEGLTQAEQVRDQCVELVKLLKQILEEMEST